MTRLLSNEQFFSCLRVRELSISHGRSYSINSGNPVSDFQNLEILNLIGCEMWSFFHGLEPPDGPVPCSLLKEIRVIAYHDRQFEWWQFMRMVEARWRMVWKRWFSMDGMEPLKCCLHRFTRR